MRSKSSPLEENNEKDLEIAKLVDEKERIYLENENLRTDLTSKEDKIQDLEQQLKTMTENQMAASSNTLVGSTIQVAGTGHNFQFSGKENDAEEEDSIVEPTTTSQLEQSLSEAESKISELLKVKEKFAEVRAENSTLAMNLSEMQQDVNLMTRTAQACALIPLAVVLLAMLAYYFPYFGAGSGSSPPSTPPQ